MSPRKRKETCSRTVYAVSARISRAFMPISTTEQFVWTQGLGVKYILALMEVEAHEKIHF